MRAGGQRARQLAPDLCAEEGAGIRRSARTGPPARAVARSGVLGLPRHAGTGVGDNKGLARQAPVRAVGWLSKYLIILPTHQERRVTQELRRLVLFLATRREGVQMSNRMTDYIPEPHRA
jgi:hypothetical protein